MAVRKIPKDAHAIGQLFGFPMLPTLLRRFLFGQLNPSRVGEASTVPLDQCPQYNNKVTVFPSAVATFYAPSDESGLRGMRRERIRAVPTWRGHGPRRDCVYVDNGSDLPGFRGLDVARVLLLMSVSFHHTTYPCALVTWFSCVDDKPCEDTGLWVVEPDVDAAGERIMEVIHLDSIFCLAHLIGNAGDNRIPRKLHHQQAYDAFTAFYVNKYADHHAHTIAF